MEALAQGAALPAKPATLYRSAQLPTAAAQPSAASNSPASVQTARPQPKQAQASGNWLRSWVFISLPKGGKKSSQIRLCCAIPDYILTIGGWQSSGVHALSTDPICNPIKPCMANLGNLPQSIRGAVGTTFGMSARVTLCRARLKSGLEVRWILSLCCCCMQQSHFVSYKTRHIISRNDN